MTKRIMLLAFATLLLTACSGATETARTPETKIKYMVWEQCFDNDEDAFDQMRAAKYVDEQFTEFSSKYAQYTNCEYHARGKQDVIGCTGDVYYNFTCDLTQSK